MTTREELLQQLWEERMSEGTRVLLLAFPSKKKLAFLVLLYERMIAELRSFCLAESRDFSIFQRAREDFWRFLADGNSSTSRARLLDDILDALPFAGPLEASFALNAGTVAAETAAFIADGEDQHLVEATQLAYDSIDFKVRDLLQISSYNRIDKACVMAHPLMTRERQIEEEDVSFPSHCQTANGQQIYSPCCVIERNHSAACSLISSK